MAGWLVFNFGDLCKCLKKSIILTLEKEKNLSKHYLMLFLWMTVTCHSHSIFREV